MENDHCVAMLCAMYLNRAFKGGEWFRWWLFLSLAGQCDEWDVRLEDGETETVGRLGLCLNGIWGSVAAGGAWGNAEAAVVCRQLGYLDTGARTGKHL